MNPTDSQTCKPVYFCEEAQTLNKCYDFFFFSLEGKVIIFPWLGLLPWSSSGRREFDE